MIVVIVISYYDSTVIAQERQEASAAQRGEYVQQ